ncbi:MAG: hypothetical protein QXG39_04135 [Candidatus Aenigmatarchaeota archaeon]
MKEYRCLLCKKIFGTRKEIRKHIREIHKVKGFRKRHIPRGKRKGSSDITKNMEAYEI